LVDGRHLANPLTIVKGKFSLLAKQFRRGATSMSGLVGTPPPRAVEPHEIACDGRAPRVLLRLDMTARWIVITAALGVSLPAFADPAPAPMIPAPYEYRPPSATRPLDDNDRSVLEQGEISDAQTTGGGIAAIFVGFGVGQAIQGRWLERGWMFTVVDAGAGTLEAAGVIELFGRGCNHACENRGLAMIGGAAAIELGSRILQTWDAFVAPEAHNRRVRELRARTGLTRVMPYVTPNGIGIGLQM
jgi:hypothetical protein